MTDIQKEKLMTFVLFNSESMSYELIEELIQIKQIIVWWIELLFVCLQYETNNKIQFNYDTNYNSVFNNQLLCQVNPTSFGKPIVIQLQ